MPSFGFLKGKFFGNAASTAAGFAGGIAVAPALEPLVQEIRNEAWKTHPDVPPEAQTLAEGVAQGQVTMAYAQARAAEQGLSKTAFQALVNIANTGPALGYAFEAWRRGFLTAAEFQTALTRTGLESQWFAAIEKLKTRLLDPADLARGIHKGLIPDPGLLAVPAPSGTGNVPAYPVYQIDALAAAEGYGYTRDDLGVLVGLQGNPMGAHEAAQATFRGVIQKVDYDRAIAEGNTRNEWGDAIMEQSRAIPTIHEYVENTIRGYTTLDQAKAGAAKHGMKPDDVEIVYQNAGRPLTPHQITQALARGAKFNPLPGEVADPYEAAAHESNVHIPYQEMYASLRYNYPPLFQLNQLVKSGTITADDAKDWAQKQGYAPEVVDVLYTFWQGESGGGTTSNVKPKTLTRAELKAAWKTGQLDDATVTQRLESEGLSPADAATLLATWKAQPPPSGG